MDNMPINLQCIGLCDLSNQSDYAMFWIHGATMSGRTTVTIYDPPSSIYGEAGCSGQHGDAVIVEPGEHPLQVCFPSVQFFVLGVGQVSR